MSDVRPVLPNWYKYKRSKKEQRCIYGFLRFIGLSREQARRVYGWSKRHIIEYIKNYNNE